MQQRAVNYTGYLSEALHVAIVLPVLHFYPLRLPETTEDGNHMHSEWLATLSSVF